MYIQVYNFSCLLLAYVSGYIKRMQTVLSRYDVNQCNALSRWVIPYGYIQK